jgi:dienelactone hydrolase
MTDRDTVVSTVRFTVPRPGQDVPAVVWRPAGPPAPGRPLVLLGHGGGMHKESPFFARLGRRLARELGYAALAIDLPLHGERTPPAERGMSPLQRREHLGLDAWRIRNAAATGQAVGDWQAALEAVRAQATRPGPVGYLGLSMGTRFGVPLLAAEPRIGAAVLGLFGLTESDPEAVFARAARQVTAPVLFLLQWDDQLFPRPDGLALFDQLGSPDKTLHASPGGHFHVPAAEIDAAVRFLGAHLGVEPG